MKRIDLNIDETDSGDDLRLMYNGEPFTGEAVESVGDQLLSQEFYVDGIAHGTTREWWPNGQLKMEGQLRHGLECGVFRRWHENGQLAAEKQFDDFGTLHTEVFSPGRCLQVKKNESRSSDRADPPRT
ncbi:hypothetical protein IU457_23840 [Nocardia cyriacigeorgica]|nr:hypothetical protein [Nocardia cyriacigeorgica]